MSEAVVSEAPAPVPGVRLSAVPAGIRYPDRLDLVLLEFAPGTRAAAVFTKNAFCAAPVQVARQHLAQCHGAPKYALINTGNANAGTGEQGLADARRCCNALGALLDVAPSSVIPFSTGVIGEDLPVAPIEAAMHGLVSELSPDGWADAARGILTTDTRPKLASTRVNVNGRSFTITGMAKGAGMLRPDMATMLAYVATDAPLAQGLLEQLLAGAVEHSFHRITVDGDTSTNDAVLLAATGAEGGDEILDAYSAEATALQDAFDALFIALAQGLVRDGEGASKFVALAVSGGRDSEECLAVAFTVAHSPLVKTALFAGDPNWGRLLAAIGRAGVTELDVVGVRIAINDVLIAEGGARAKSYVEEAGAAAMSSEDLTIHIDLGRGDAAETVWTSDFSYDYVRINAEYRS